MQMITSGTSLFGVRPSTLASSVSEAGSAVQKRGLLIPAVAAAGACMQPLQRAAAGNAQTGTWSSCHGGRLPDSFGALSSTGPAPAVAWPISSSTAGHSAGHLGVQHGGQTRQCSSIEAACQQAASAGASMWQPWRRHLFGDVSLSYGRSGLAALPHARSWALLQPRAISQLAFCRSGAVRQVASTAGRRLPVAFSVLHCRHVLRMLIH